MMLKRTNTEDVQTRFVDVDYWSRRRDEEKQREKEKEYQEFEKQLLEDSEFSNDYYNCEWREEPPKDENSLTQIDFMRMDFRECEYHLYKQLVNISSLLSYIKDVVIDDRKL